MKFESKTYDLSCPVEVEVTEGETTLSVPISSVTISTPKGKSLRIVMRLLARLEDPNDRYSDAEMVMDALAAMSDLPEGGVDELHPFDITALSDIAGPFLQAAMGQKPSSPTSPNGTAATSTK